MPLGEALNDDDYVINLLKKDAQANQKRSLANGLGSLLSSKPRGNAPKPNTRFLQNIIRDTDSHNAALKAKEEEESRVRLKELRREQNGTKRRLEEDVDEGSSKRRRGEDKPGRWQSVLGGLGKASGERPRRGNNERKGVRGSGKGTDKRHDTTRGDSDRRRDRDDDTRRRVDDRSASPKRRKEHRRRWSKSRSRSPKPDRRGRGAQSEDSASDSDPLDEILGPKAPPKHHPRGRGGNKSSDMDARFNSTYDPKQDVDLTPDEDRDDWDMALEAVRDRAKWKAQGADRLRAAGFTDSEVSKWEKGSLGGEKDVEEVRWRRKGEDREWDRGKVLDGEGKVGVKPEWARPKT